jgi:quercetin dioxygenase-like cupin family protein
VTHPSALTDRLAAFALGLPDADPDGSVATHLADGCTSCATDLRQLRETAALLGLGIQSLPPTGGLRERVADRISGESYAYVLSSTGEWREERGISVKQLYVTSNDGGTSLVSLRTGSGLAEAYRPGDLGYVLLRGELDGEGLRLGPGDFVPAAGKVPGRQLSVVMDTILLAVAGSEQAAPLDSPRAVRSGRAAWNPAEPGVVALPLAGSAEEGVELSLVRMEPGATLPRHRHDWVEEICLLSGDLRCQGVELGPEDYHRAGPATTHEVAATVRGCTMVYITRRKPLKP